MNLDNNTKPLNDEDSGEITKSIRTDRVISGKLAV